MKLSQLLLIVFVLFVIGCGETDKKSPIQIANVEIQNVSEPELNEQAQEQSFKPFYVYSDKGQRVNHFIPSGFMPNGKCIKFNDSYGTDCYGGKTCIENIYDVACSRKDQRWAGIYWLNPPNNWGSRKGGFNLTGASKLTFWAKGQYGGEQIQEVTIGGISGDYPDSDTAVIGPIILSSQWKQYTIDLRGKDLSYISGGFAWTTSEDVNGENCIFYLDEIKFE